MKPTARSAKRAKSNTPKAPPPAAPPASSSASSIRDRELEKRRKVFKQSFDSPLKVKWGTPASADLQSELIDLLTARIFSPTPTNPTLALHRGLQSTFRLLAARICNPLKQLVADAQEKVPGLAIVLFRGDLDETLSGPDLYGWVPGLAQLAKCAGHQVHLFVVTQAGASVKVSSAIRQLAEKKGGKQVPRFACIAIELQSNLASNDLVALAARFPTPTVPFYTAASDASNVSTFTEWAKLVNKPSLLSPNIKLLETSAPIVDRKQQKEAKTAAKVEQAAKQQGQPKPIQRKSGPQLSSKAQADKKRQGIASEIARGGPLAVPAFGCVRAEEVFATPLDKVRAMLKAKAELREQREKHVSGRAIEVKSRANETCEVAADAMDVDAKVEGEGEETMQEEVPQHEVAKVSKKRQRSFSESSAASPPSLLDPTEKSTLSKKRRTTPS